MHPITDHVMISFVVCAALIAFLDRRQVLKSIWPVAPHSIAAGILARANPRLKLTRPSAVQTSTAEVEHISFTAIVDTHSGAA